MKKRGLTKIRDKHFPVLIEKGRDGFYVVECLLFDGCFTQGKTMDEALRNIKEVIEICLEEKENKKILAEYQPEELSLHTIKL